jgi:hypothetical protein
VERPRRQFGWVDRRQLAFVSLLFHSLQGQRLLRERHSAIYIFVILIGAASVMFCLDLVHAPLRHGPNVLIGRRLASSSSANPTSW